MLLRFMIVSENPERMAHKKHYVEKRRKNQSVVVRYLKPNCRRLGLRGLKGESALGSISGVHVLVCACVFVSPSPHFRAFVE